MSGDQLVGIIAVMAMLLLVMRGLVQRELPAAQALKMAGIWAIIIAGIAAVIWFFGLQPR